jgi:hypothetical protein
MKYLIFSAVFAISSLTTTSAFSLPLPLLQLDQYSGFVIPSAAIEAHCSLVLLPDGKGVAQLKTEIHKGRASDGTWMQESSSEKSIIGDELVQVNNWLADAAAGPFQQGGNPCDIGTYKIMAQNYPLIDSEDCGKKTVNLNPSVAPLISWFQKACAIEGIK